MEVQLPLELRWTCFLLGILSVASQSVTTLSEAPSNVSLEECYMNQATLRWNFHVDDSNDNEQYQFLVEYDTTRDPDEWQQAIAIPYSPGQTEYEASVMLPSVYTAYNFRVIAYGSMGRGDPVNATSPCITPPDVPQKHPDNVRTDVQDTGFLVIQWDPLDLSELNGPGFLYRVQFQKVGSPTFESLAISDYEQGEVRSRVYNIYEPYKIRVMSENSVGRAFQRPVTIIGYSGEAPPSVTVENLELDQNVNVTDTSAGFQWDPVNPSPDVINGELVGYMVYVCKRDTAVFDCQNVTVLEKTYQESGNIQAYDTNKNENNNKVRAVVTNLPSSTDLEATVIVINNNFPSETSNYIRFRTPEKALPEPASELIRNACYRDRAVLSWNFHSEDSARPSNGIQGYEFLVDYKTNHDPDQWERAVVVPYRPEKTEYEVSVVLPFPFTQYSFRVMLTNSTGQSELEKVPSYCYTPSDRPYKNPDNVRTDSRETGFLVVQWDPMKKREMNGHGFIYIVDVLEVGGSYHDTFPIEDNETGELRLSVNNVYKPYEIRVTSENSRGESQQEALTIIGYSGEAPSRVTVENLELDQNIKITDTSAGFQWDPVNPSPDAINGEFVGYRIYICDRDSNDNACKVFNVTVNGESNHENGENLTSNSNTNENDDNKVRAVVTNLPPSTNLEATVVVLNNNFESEASNVVSFRTPGGVSSRAVAPPTTVALPLVHEIMTSETKANISWQILVSSESGCKGQFYYLEFMKINDHDWLRKPEKIEDRLWGVLHDLDPNTQYKARIVASGPQGGASRASDPYVFKTKGSADNDQCCPCPAQ